MEAPKIEGNIRRIVFVLCGFLFDQNGGEALAAPPVSNFFDSKP